MAFGTTFAAFGIVGLLTLAVAARLEDAPGSGTKPALSSMKCATGLVVRLFQFSGLR